MRCLLWLSLDEGKTVRVSKKYHKYLQNQEFLTTSSAVPVNIVNMLPLSNSIQSKGAG